MTGIHESGTSPRPTEMQSKTDNAVSLGKGSNDKPVDGSIAKNVPQVASTGSSAVPTKTSKSPAGVDTGMRNREPADLPVQPADSNVKAVENKQDSPDPSLRSSVEKGSSIMVSSR